MTEPDVHREGPGESQAAKGFIRGSIAGFVLVFSIGFLVALNAGADLMPAIGIATFAGIWGGPGFGGMIGATLAAVRYDEAEDEAARIQV